MWGILKYHSLVISNNRLNQRSVWWVQVSCRYVTFWGILGKPQAVRVSGMETAQWLVGLRVAGEIRKGKHVNNSRSRTLDNMPDVCTKKNGKHNLPWGQLI